ncbi:DNA-formamidopyrimidine glycosylase, partial [Mycoplasma hyorhinis]|nr:DNA-formamidopyrimidine glycosylase [Mesomycoplasma hyorhinis]
MPELPEVVTVVNQLNEKIINKKVVSVKLYKEKLLKNSTVEQLENWFVNEKILSV